MVEEWPKEVKVYLLAFSQWNPEIWPQDRYENWKHPEHIMATGKRICQTSAGLVDVINETHLVEERVRKSVEDGHLGVLEHAVFTFLIEGISRCETHQHVRHRIASYLQMSQRYVDALELMFITPPSVQMTYLPEDLEEDMKKLEELSRSVYDRLQKNSIPREDARMYLLHGWESRLWMTVNTRALMHFLKLRTHRSAQWEIREVANQMHAIMKRACPTVFDEELRKYWE